MKLYRKLPIVIEAIQLTNKESLEHIALNIIPRDKFAGYGTHPVYLLIDTLEGTMRADEGDWIVKGPFGEYYPVKPDIFDATYELVESD